MAEKIIIAGGGIAGLAAAVALARAGLATHVYERQNAFSTEGAGIQLGPNAIRALRRLDLWDSMQPHVFLPGRIVFRDGMTGRQVGTLPLGARFEARFGAGYAVAHRKDLHRVLIKAAEALPEVTMTTGTAVTQYGDEIFSLSTGETVRADFCIAADGIASDLRTASLGLSGPRAAGLTIHRALIDPTDLPTAIEADAVTLWFYPKAHVVHYPVEGGRTVNLVVSIDGGTGRDGWSRAVNADEVTRHFGRAASKLQALLQIPDTWRCWAGRYHKPSRGWSNDHIGLIGDAAHASLPTLAQGAAMALEDAVCLGQGVRKSRDITTAMREMERQRFHRTARLIKTSSRLARVYHFPPPLSYARNMMLALSPASFAYRQLAWLYDG